MSTFFKTPPKPPAAPSNYAQDLRVMLNSRLVYPYYVPAVLDAIRALEAEQARKET